MVYSNDPDTPITIKSTPYYAELDQQEFNLYNDDMKTAQYVNINLPEIDKITIPKSFRQPGYEINCFQINTKKFKNDYIKVDLDKDEPYTSVDTELTLCFKNTAEMEGWKNAIIDFNQNCNVDRPNIKEIDSQEKEEVEQMGNVEKKIKNLVETAVGLKKEFEVIER